MTYRPISRLHWLGSLLVVLAAASAAAKENATVYVVLWFDTEDYLLPASDDAALRLAEFLSGAGIRATFKVVGEKARTVWLGSQPASPESYLVALAAVARQLAENKPPPSVTLRQARLAAGKYVVDDQPGLWGWVIFPPGFHAPAMMELARRQAWTIKPAVLPDRGQ